MTLPTSPVPATDGWKLDRIMKLRFQLLVTVVTLIMTSGCLFSDDVPKKNPNPKQLMLISGTTVQFASLRIIAVYATNNPSCEVYANWLELGDTKTPQTFNVEIPVQQIGEKYEATVPLDEFQESECQWQPFQIMVNLRLNGEPPVKVEPHTDLMMLAQPLVYFPNPGLNVNGVRIWEHGPNPPTLRIFCMSKDRKGDAHLVWWEDKIPGYNQNRFVIPPQEREVTINLVDQTAGDPSP
jgi:hypothetical protein